MKKLLYIFSILLVGITFVSCSSDDNNSKSEQIDTEEAIWNTPENKAKYQARAYFSLISETPESPLETHLIGVLVNNSDKPVSGIIVYKYSTNEGKNMRFEIPMTTTLPTKGDIVKIKMNPPYYPKEGTDKSYFIPK